MANLIKTTTLDGQPIEFIDEVKASGGMKDVYFSPDRSYVVALFRDKPDFHAKDRLIMITGKYRDSVFSQAGGDYWRNLYCWPTAAVEINGKLGVTAPFYQKQFFFEHGSKNNDFLDIKGKDKEGKWFASANNQNRYLDPRERGDWLNYLRIGILISRAVRRLHAAGLAHSDLSYKNVLVDPVRGGACIIDIDGLVVPGKYPPDVIGTPDFIAPEVVATSHLPKEDKNRKLPCIATDRHALAVLIYMFLLYRHPLRGARVCDLDPEKDEKLCLGSQALFVEHPADASNRIRPSDAKPSELPWKDTARVPFSVTGPYLSELFKHAFIDGLHEVTKRPTADEWEVALVKTVDLVQPCRNPDCAQKWYVFDNTRAPKCPFCGTPYQGKLPILKLYSARKEGCFRPDNHRLMVYTNQSLFPWHVNRNIFPNERLAPEHRKRVGYFVLHAGAWWLVNEALPDLADVTIDNKIAVPVGGKVELKDGQKLLLSRDDGGRLVVVQMVEGA